ncbi:uncharacterized protein EV420DRAFT_1273710 [Desarmillaria tabescens]|uniref:ATP-dependent DNA helicase n=1 Tax=Armillaria tabescens TaxID=1929756 RepID=A0AA39K1C6_ARMTA|nr:uncharacterized protein EV420DRAFT_1273710 [Desarmillaria tabescens]KAK0452781.1 hypothetical protein EV420DRAFT_1273710 [Desarmillaria tabescens]
MVGTKLLVQILNALCVAKEDSSAFGGINIIFAGNFAQLPPVRDSKLFAQVDRTRGTDSALTMIQGRLLWLSVDTVIILHQVMRQEGDKNASFVEIADRVRPDWTSKEWLASPLIVSENAVKDAFNRRATEAFAARTGRKLHYYYADDMH